MSSATTTHLASVQGVLSQSRALAALLWPAKLKLLGNMFLQTRALLRIAEEEEEQAATRPSAVGSRIVDDTPQQQWDCESVLSLRSNLDNHPGTISEQSSRRYKPASGRIKLAAKTGEQHKCDALFDGREVHASAHTQLCESWQAVSNTRQCRQVYKNFTFNWSQHTLLCTMVMHAQEFCSRCL